LVIDLNDAAGCHGYRRNGGWFDRLDAIGPKGAI
jgi:hypothetical protein